VLSGRAAATQGFVRQAMTLTDIDFRWAFLSVSEHYLMRSNTLKMGM